MTVPRTVSYIVHIGSVMILPELDVLATTYVQIVTWTQGVSVHYKCKHKPCVVSDLSLVSFPFYTIPMRFLRICRSFIYFLQLLSCVCVCMLLRVMVLVLCVCVTLL